MMGYMGNTCELNFLLSVNQNVTILGNSVMEKQTGYLKAGSKGHKVQEIQGEL